MTNKYMYFIANWKMFGDLKTLNSLDKVIKFLRLLIVKPFNMKRINTKKPNKSKYLLGFLNFYNLIKLL